MSNLNIYYQNCRGLRTKLRDFKLEVLENDFDVICLTETWLNDSIDSCEAIDNRYDVFRCDRNYSKTNSEMGGGVLIAVKKNLQNTKLEDLECNSENSWVKIKLMNGHCLVICTVYFAPKSKYDEYKYFLDYVSNFVTNANINTLYLIVGDFNLSSIEWAVDENANILVSSHEGRVAEYLLDSLSLNNFAQFNIVKNHQGKILDLILSNVCANQMELHPSLAVLSKIDKYHPPLHIILNLLSVKTQPNAICRSVNFSRLNYEKISEGLDTIQWAEVFSDLSINEAIDLFYNKLFFLIDQNGKKTKSCDNFEKYPIWYSPLLKRLIKHKFRIFTKWKIYKNPFDYKVFSLFRKKVKSEINTCYKKYILNTEELIMAEPKKFWDYTKSLNSKTEYPREMYLGDIKTVCGEEISNLFAKNFESVYEKASLISAPNSEHREGNFCNLINLINESDVSDLISKLDIYKGAGPDQIPNSFVKKLNLSLTTPLTLLFNKSINQAVFPTRWKESFISPIFKSGDAANVANYRPISILNSFSKIFEKLIHKVVFTQVKNQISSEQHGFFHKRSTLTNLLEFSENLSNCLDGNGQIDCIYTDFSKAFDKVNHSILIDKLNSFNISKRLQHWLSSYLVDRLQFVRFIGYKSNPITPSSGVPQGSILGPLLFLLFINDISKKLKCKHLLYADDLKIFKSIHSIQDCIDLQEDLTHLQRWCDHNCLHLNLRKCMVITYSRKKINKILFDYSIDTIYLMRVESIKDLGVTFDSKLKFDIHVDTICRKAHRVLGFIFRRGKDFRNPQVFITLFNSLVRSHLEYACQIWNPFYDIYCHRIEGLQRKFTRFLAFRTIPFTEKLSYRVRLEKLNIVSLESRRLLLDEFLLFKIVNSLLDTNILNKLNFYASAYRTRYNKLFLPASSRTNVGLASPLNRIQANHNEYFNDLDLFSNTLSSFKLQSYNIINLYTIT